eukprot:TRINITY_DN2265_c0_g1_i1.p3 TRINITY_DN2265_c0_g1~~TRINITY_DN2265_c0_g1_i1.p3  ORF type:complete len:328 (+),score=58.39 TRINITY_DN2265_c0_g1_i1:1165-2148(+)
MQPAILQTMGLVIRGAFDIGSAATKLQVAVVDVSSGKIKKVLFGEERQVFFALDMSKSKERALSHSIQDEGIRVLGSFMDVLSEHKAQQVSAIATEVFRRASNGDAYLKRVERELGLKIRMVTQEEEALLGYKTATGLCDPSIDTRNVIAWDTGGASFQISTMQQGVFEAYRGKFGSSIVTAMCLQQVKPTSTTTPNPVTPEEASQLGALIAPELAPPPSWLSGHVEAVGGPNSTFCLASRTLGKSTVSLADVEGCLARTCGRADSELRKMCHLSPKHDPPAMVVPKFVLLHTVMLHCGITDFTFIPAIGSCAGMLVSDELYAIGKL